MNFSQLNFGVFAIKIYGLLLSIAFLIAVLRFYKRIIQKDFSVEFFLHHFWRWVLGGVVLGRISALFFEPQILSQYGLFSFFAFWEGEIYFFGALVGFLFAMYLDLRKQKENFLQWLDLAVPAIFLGVLIVDWAQFFTGAIYGKETDFFWGVQYETFGVEILNPVHPVSLYAFLAHFWIFHGIKKYEKKLEKFPGKLSFQAGILFFSTDFLLQFVRGDNTFMLFDFWRIEQVFDVVMLGILTLFLWKDKK
ncbi:prolipoprotein diacylglyceryl transferase [Candidatus Gracilibacteria bacterium]|nr:prolipoprotein diacylglyceryl transferase [Candidatus Gracilibacteria bacterium]